MKGSILILNSGSSSLKYEVFRYEKGETLVPLARGLIEKIGEPGSGVGHHLEAIKILFEAQRSLFLDQTLLGIGHRVVHGGERFKGAVEIDDAVLSGIREAIPMAPLHNPANLAGIEATRNQWPRIPEVAIFDTAFHQTLPESAWRYAIGEACEGACRIRRYGFHGTSYSSICRQVSVFLGKRRETLNLMVLHLGNGASVCAIREGQSVDTSMGMTPTAGLVMGTRTGDLDPGILLHWMRTEGITPDLLDRRLNRESGLMGLSGTNDMRELLQAVDAGCDRSSMALSVYVHRIRHYIGAYLTQLPQLDALVFTGGVGEHAARVRMKILENLAHLGFSLDLERNAAKDSGIREIQRGDGGVRILVAPANEEREIAIQVCEVLGLEPRELGGAEL